MANSTRRQFLGGAGLVAAAAALVPRSMFADAMKLPVGIQLYMVHDAMEKDTPGTLAELYRIGFREVEGAGSGKYSAREFRRLVEDAGLKIPSAHFDMSGKELGSIFDEANGVGAHYVCSPSPPLPAETLKRLSGAALFGAWSDRLNLIGRQAKAAGLQYACHNLATEFEKMPDGSYGMDFLMKHTDESLVKFELDCGWMLVAGADPVSFMDRYPGRTRMLHIKDFRKKMPPTLLMLGPEVPVPVDLGHGYADYRGIFAAGEKHGIEHCFAEQDSPFEVSSLASAREAYKFLHAAR